MSDADVLTAPKYTNGASQALYDAALKCGINSKFTAAISALDKLYEHEPLDFFGHFLYGICCVENDQPRKGLDHLTQVFNGGQQDNVTVLYFLGRAHLRLKQSELARAFFEKALAINQDHSPSLANLGHICLRADQLDDAKNYYLKALQSDGKDNPGIMESLASVYYWQGDLGQAIEIMKKVIRLAPTAHNHSSLGTAYIKAGLYKDALVHSTMGLVLDPSNPISQGNYAVVLQRLGQPNDRVLREIDKALKMNPERAVSHIQAACTLNRMGLFDKAIATYDTGIKLTGGNLNGVKFYLYRAWNHAIRDNEPVGFIAERLAALGGPVAVPDSSSPLP